MNLNNLKYRFSCVNLLRYVERLICAPGGKSSSRNSGTVAKTKKTWNADCTRWIAVSVHGCSASTGFYRFGIGIVSIFGI